eukprot:2690951-Rhodomonas_salina.4
MAPAPAQQHAHVLQFPIWDMKGKKPGNIGCSLNIQFSNQQMLQDLRIQDLTGQPGLTAQLAVWIFLATATADGTDSVTALRALTEADGLMNLSLLEQ